ncbi:hypothetical protein [Treponema pedis]|uniref:hypothetical protein n=1 Tax=Treponema pedis TaxID=409322 RepID=UPI00040EA365|nr:hypothetical protein [Treponema pedis]
MIRKKVNKVMIKHCLQSRTLRSAFAAAKTYREFKTTVKTVRKWSLRWQQGKLSALKDIS